MRASIIGTRLTPYAGSELDGRRSIARSLGLDEDPTEAVALAQ